MKENKRGGKREGAGRKPLSYDEKKHSSMVRIPEPIKPFIEQVKRAYKANQVDSEVLTDLSIDIQYSNNENLNHLFKINKEYKQTSALTEDDIKEQAELIERLTTENETLKVQNQILEKKLHGNSDNQAIIDQLTKENEELQKIKANSINIVLQRDKEHAEVIRLQGKIKDLEREPERLKAEIKRLNDLQFNCQCLKTNGQRCTRPAKTTKNYNGIRLNVCLQHKKSLDNK